MTMGWGGEVVRNDNILKEVKQITTVESSVELAQKKKLKMKLPMTQ